MLSCLGIGFPNSSVGKESACSAGDPSSIPGLARSTREGIGYPLQYSWASLVAQLVKNLPATWETWFWSLGWEDPWRRERLPTPVFWPGEFLFHFPILGGCCCICVYLNVMPSWTGLSDFHFHFTRSCSLIQKLTSERTMRLQLLEGLSQPYIWPAYQRACAGSHRTKAVDHFSLSFSAAVLTCYYWWVCVLVTQLFPTLCYPMDCSPPGFSVYGILQARILEWIAMPSSRGSSQPRDWTQISYIAGRVFTDWAMREAFFIL